MSENKNLLFKSEYDWCRNCGETLRFVQYLNNSLSNILTSETGRNEKEEIEKSKFYSEHNENCKEKKKITDISEIVELIEQKLPEFRAKKKELENSFIESRDITKLEDFFDYDFFG